MEAPRVLGISLPIYLTALGHAEEDSDSDNEEFSKLQKLSALLPFKLDTRK
jgi:hypothetical protein